MLKRVGGFGGFALWAAMSLGCGDAISDLEPIHDASTDSATDATVTDARASFDAATMSDAGADATMDARVLLDAAAMPDAGGDATMDAAALVDADVVDAPNATDDDAGGANSVLQWEEGVCGTTCLCSPPANAPTWIPRGTVRGDYHQPNEPAINAMTAHALSVKRMIWGGFNPKFIIGGTGTTSFVLPGRPPANNFTFVMEDAARLCRVPSVEPQYALTGEGLVTRSGGTALGADTPTWARESLPYERVIGSSWQVVTLLPHEGRVLQWDRESATVYDDVTGALTGFDNVEHLMWVDAATGATDLAASFQNHCRSASGIAFDEASQTAVVSLWDCGDDNDGSFEPDVVHDGRLIAIDLNTGVVRWRATLPGLPVLYPELYPEPMVLAVTDSDTDSDAGTGTTSSTRVTIAHGSTDLHVFDLETGTTMWTMPPRAVRPLERVRTAYGYDGTRLVLATVTCDAITETSCANGSSVIQWIDPRDGFTLHSTTRVGTVAPPTTTTDLTFLVGESLDVIDSATGAVLLNILASGAPATTYGLPTSIADGRVYATTGYATAILTLE